MYIYVFLKFHLDVNKPKVELSSMTPYGKGPFDYNPPSSKCFGTDMVH